MGDMERDETRVIEYSTRVGVVPVESLSPRQKRAADVLLGWAIVNWIGTPLGLVLALGAVWGMVVFAVGYRETSGEDWVAICVGVPSALCWGAMPVWAVMCHVCRGRILRGLTWGAELGERLCWVGLGGVGLFGLALGVGVWKAVRHGRWEELTWWLPMVAVTAGVGVMVVWTSGVLRAAREEMGSRRAGR